MIYTKRNPPDKKFFNSNGEEITLGMLVSGSEDGRDVVGEVVAFDEDGYYTFGVYSDDPEFDGHNLGRVLDRKATRGWWCSDVDPVLADMVIPSGDFQDFLS